MKIFIKKFIKSMFVVFLSFGMFLSNIPFGFIDLMIKERQDGNVVDVLWQAMKDGRVIDTIGPKKAQAIVTPTGVLGFSETAADDNMQFLSFTSTATYTDRGNSVDTTANANDLQHIRLEMAPTRDEMMSGQLEVNGTLHITRCVGGCDASGDWSEEIEISGVNGTLTCDTTAGACERAYDIAYEQLGGRAVVFYGKTANDGIVYFNIWDGTSWVGEDSFEFKASSTADTEWIRAIPEGDDLSPRRSNRILIIAEDNAEDIRAMIYDNGTISDLTTITNTSFTSDNARDFDGAWESVSGDAIVVWGEGTTAATNPFRYSVYDTSTDSWDGSANNVGTVYTNTNTARWVNLASDLRSDRIGVTFEGSGADYRPGMWKSDGSTPGFTLGTEDASTESILMNQTSVAWERYNNGTSFALFINTDSGTSDVSDYQTFTGGSGFGGPTDMSGAMGDDAGMWKLYSSPNSDEVMAVGVEYSDDLCFQRWSGSAWDADCTTTEYSTTLPPDTATTANEGFAFNFSYRWYSPWARNWRFYSGADTGAQPTTALANENTTPTGFDASSGTFRLRYSVAELSNMSQTDSRKILQWTTDDPDDVTATWTDVDDVSGAGIWRYVDCNGGSSVCDDNTTITGSAVLSGSPTLGWWTQDRDAAGGSVMDHSAGQLRELEYSVEANGANGGTTYYFRMYDNDQQTPVFREQDDDGSNDCATAVCTYPSLTTQGLSTPIITTNFVTNGSATAVTLNGEKIGGDSATQHGFAYSTNSGLTSGVSTTTLGALSTNTTFSDAISSLNPNTTYYYRAYATNSGGTGFGVIRSFYTGNSNITRYIRLFEGFLIKFFSGKVILYQS